MRHIQKRQAPRTLDDTRNASTTDLSAVARARAAFDQIDKTAVRLALTQEQGWLCAFCMRAINETTLDKKTGQVVMKIAHRTPIAVDSSRALDWKNLFGSCDGGQRSQTGVSTCDLKQESTALTVDPGDQNSVAQLHFERREGRPGLFLTSTNASLRDDVETTLNLNGGDLPLYREAALKAFNLLLQREHPTNHWEVSVRKRFFASWRDRGGGKLREFLGVIEKNGRVR